MRIAGALLSLLLVVPAVAAGQVRGDAHPRMLDPLHGFDPFAPAVTAARYFPDGIEQRTRRALLDALGGHGSRLRDHVRYIEERDRELQARGDRASGLSHALQDLHHAGLADRDAYRMTLQEALESASTDARRRHLRARLAEDELEQADALVAESDIGRWNDLLNRMLGSVDLIGWVSGSYLTAAVDTAFAELFRGRAPRMPAGERKALVLYKRFLARLPNHPQGAAIKQKVAALEAKKTVVWLHRHDTQAAAALAEGRIDDADFHARLAATVAPEAETVKERLKEIEAARKTRDEERGQVNSVADADDLSNSSAEAREDIRALLHALARRNAAAAREQAEEMAQRYDGERLGSLARDVAAVALEMDGRHADAKRTLVSIADAAPSERSRERARILLDSPEYNLRGALDREHARYRLDQVRFALLGENFLEKNAMIGAAPIITHGIAGAATLGAANILMVTSNLLEMLSGNPVSNQTVVDAAARAVRARPESEESGDIYQTLGDAYRSQGHPHKAVQYYRLSGKTPADEVRELEEEAGRTLLRAAEGTESKSRQRALYAALLGHYPDTPAGDEAKGRLARLAAPKNRGLRLSKQYLAENPRLHGPAALGLKPALFDGRVQNLELAEAGLNVLGRDALLLHYDTPWGALTRTYPVARARIEGLEILLREKRYAMAARGAGEPVGVDGLDFPGRLMRYEPRDPGADASDLEFVRETAQGARDRSAILDHELLSTKETDPQRAYGLPTVRGSVTAAGVSMRADAPDSFLADELVVGNDAVSPYAGVRLPIPLLKDFIPVDFLLRARPGLPSLTPQIRKPDTAVDDAHLYR
ncbi:MAG: hypothetical protein OXF11_04735 [Deltaproteobacteria bacterium]|nr:hypothetical protein [Deltaproteobacteria bacterium]